MQQYKMMVLQRRVVQRGGWCTGLFLFNQTVVQKSKPLPNYQKIASYWSLPNQIIFNNKRTTVIKDDLIQVKYVYMPSNFGTKGITKHWLCETDLHWPLQDDSLHCEDRRQYTACFL